MPYDYTLDADECPAPQSLADDLSLYAAELVTDTFEAILDGAAAAQALRNRLLRNFIRCELMARLGSGFVGILTGLDVTVDGLVATVGAGKANVSVPVELPEEETIALVDDADNYLWMSKGGTLGKRTSADAPNHLLPPDADSEWCYLKMVRMSGGAATLIDDSGVFYLRGGLPYRRTADAAAPGDIPSSALRFLHRTAAGLYLWDGSEYTLIDVDAHVADADPHPQYQKESEKNQANGYPGLSAGSKIDGTQITYGTAANTACEGNDSRLSDARTPTGAAGGVLAGTYPNPTFAADMATQAELDAHTGGADPHPQYAQEAALGTLAALSSVSAAELAGPVQDAIPNVLISVGAEAGDVIQVSVQFRDAANNALAERMGAYIWLSDAEYGAPVATAPSGGWAPGAGTLIEEHTAGKSGEWVSDATGLIRVDLTESGAKTLYLNVRVGNRVYASSAITFA